jgi:hypothetical protein
MFREFLFRFNKRQGETCKRGGIKDGPGESEAAVSANEMAEVQVQAK